MSFGGGSGGGGSIHSGSDVALNNPADTQVLTYNGLIQKWENRASLNDATKLAISNNLSELTNTTTARTNLGLGDAATHPSSSFDASGAASTAQSFAIQRANHSGTQSADTLVDGSTNRLYLSSEKTKLAGIATGATATTIGAAGTSGAALSATDATTSNARTPLSHASTHASGGADAIALSAAQVSSGTFTTSRIPDLTPLYDPIYHRVFRPILPTSGDATAIINAAIAQCNATNSIGTVLLSNGTWTITSPLTALNSGNTLTGEGSGTILRVGTTWSDPSAYMIPVTGKNVTVQNMQLVGGTTVSGNTASLSNVAVQGGIGVNPAGSIAPIHVNIHDIVFTAVRGWCIEAIATAASGLECLAINNIRGFYNDGGIHIQGNEGTNNAVQCMISNINIQVCYSQDVVFIEDANDVQLNTMNACVHGSQVNSVIHIKGQTSAVFIQNIDIGAYPTFPSTGPIILIESGTDPSDGSVTTPNAMRFTDGVLQGGSNNLQVDAGSNIWATGLQISRSGQGGVQLGTGAKNIHIEGCDFVNNGLSTTTGNYEIVNNSTNNPVHINNCTFRTPIGPHGVYDSTSKKTTGYVINAIDQIAGNYTSLTGCKFIGTGFTPSTIFQASTYPYIVQRNHGFNPYGAQTVAVPTSGSSANGTGSPFDSTYYVTAGTSNCTITLSGATANLSIPIPAGTTLPVSLPAGKTTLTPTWTGGTGAAAPTWVVYAN